MKKKIAILLLLATVCSSCAGEDIFAKSESAIADLGYTNIEYQGYAWFGCDSNSDYYALKYSARSKTGRNVKLAACSAPLKGVTVRTLD